jgi:hypothetical protein
VTRNSASPLGARLKSWLGGAEASAQTADRSQKRLFDFLIRVHIKRQQDAGNAADAVPAAPAANKG